jgi:hypothetical protein
LLSGKVPNSYLKAMNLKIIISRIGKVPKKLGSICCPQRRETKADTLKATEANRRRGPGTREKVSSGRINLEGNTHVQEINASQLPV